MRNHLGSSRFALLLAGALAAPLVAGCGGGSGGGSADDGHSRVDAVEQEAVAAIDGVLHDVADASGITFVSGNRFFAICGESYAPRGVVLRGFLQFEPSELTDDDAAGRAAETLEGDGWEVERAGDRPVVEGTKKELRVKVEFGPGAAVVGISTDCLETSDDVARDYDDRADVEVEWS